MLYRIATSPTAGMILSSHSWLPAHPPSLTCVKGQATAPQSLRARRASHRDWSSISSEWDTYRDRAWARTVPSVNVWRCRRCGLSKSVHVLSCVCSKSEGS